MPDMPLSDFATPVGDVHDLRPLTWILDQVQDSADEACKAAKLFAREHRNPHDADADVADTRGLRAASYELHKVVGALEMIEEVLAARMARAMEDLVRKWVNRPVGCTQAAAEALERAAFALVDYLRDRLGGNPRPALGLFPQYAQIQELAGASRIQPADLWHKRWQAQPVELPPVDATLDQLDAIRRHMNRKMLEVLRSGSQTAAGELRMLFLDDARKATDSSARVLHTLCAAFFEGLAHAGFPLDIHVKRVISRTLLQHQEVVSGAAPVDERLLLDLLFFCEQARGLDADVAPLLARVGAAWQLADAPVPSYREPVFGLYDPQVLLQCRRRVRAAKESWSALVEGQAQYLTTSTDHLRGLADSVGKLGTVMTPLAAALEEVAGHLASAGGVPAAALGMEVATTLLFLEAILDQFRPADAALAGRIVRLADRLHQVMAKKQMLALEPWMESLYRDISDKQNIDTVVGELRVTLGEVEQHLDQFFRRPDELEPLNPVPGLLAQMRGVLSVLGVEHAVSAVVRMRTDVEQLRMAPQTGSTPKLVEKLGNSLGVLGFLLDTLGYQPALARQLFFYDADAGELKFAAVPEAPTAALLPAGETAAPAAPAVRADDTQAATPPAPATVYAGADDDGDDELLGIFLDEAREVIANGLQAVQRLAEAPADEATLTELRRAFHTLKGSARMVDLGQFSAAAWSLEQLLNSWLAKGQPATSDLRAVASAALQAQERWVADLDRGTAQAWVARPFDEMADALRIHGQLRIGTLTPDSEPVEAAVGAVAEPGPDAASEPDEAMAADAPAAADETVDEAVADATTEEELEAAMPRFLHSSEFPDLSFASSEFNLLDLGDTAWDADVPTDAPDRHDVDAATDATQDSLQAEQPELDAVPGVPAPAAPEAEQPAPAAMDAESADERGAAVPAETAPDAGMRRVGHLQLSQRLFDAYVEEAKGWAQRLLAEIGQWQDEPGAPVPEAAGTAAHALAGSSATVGFSKLAELAHEVEHALVFLQEQEQATPAQVGVLHDAAEAVQRSIAAFAAGRLEVPPTAVVEAVRAIQQEALDAAATRTTIADTLDDEPVATRFANTTLATELWPIFEEEATELLDNLSAAMRLWTSAPADGDGHRQVLRILHTLKGSARLAEATELGDLVHETESLIEAFVKDQTEALPPNDAIVHQIDRIHALFDRLCGHAEQPEAGFPPSEFVFNQTSMTAFADEEDEEEPEPPAVLETAEPLVHVSPNELPAPTVLSPDTVNATDRRRMVRVRASLLDHLMAQLGELVISRASLEEDIRRLRASLADLASSIANLRRHLREVEMQAETQMQTRLARNSDIDDKFDPLEFDRYTRMQELTRMMAEAVDDVATVQRSLQRSVEAGEDDLAAQVHQSRELQHALLRARMVEFESVSERLYRLVRQAADETGKRAKLRIVGGALELDRSILDRLTAVFEHLLRNSIVHGIGSPAQRAENGKDGVGRITLTAEPVGPDVVFEIQDDGRGLDMAIIRESALARGRVDAAHMPSDHELAQLIFEPWFSTASVVTELAGRGVGLDVVRSEVRALGGHVAVSSRPGQGATFRIVVPATQALTQVTLVRMGVMAAGIPSSLIDSVQEVVAKKLTQAYEDGTMELDGETLPFFWVGALLQHSRRGRIDPGRPATVVVCRSAEQKIVVHVDEVMDELEVVIKPLGSQLSRLPGLVAVTVLATGAIALIYNPVALANVYDSEVRALMAAGQPASEQPALPLGPQPTEAVGKALILVVDDSITVRRVMERLLQRNGYRVALASDGVEGLAMLREERPAVVLSDIEMPNMDGYDFVRQIRADPTLDQLPVVMITSRAADKHRTYAMELGANDYLGKPYSEAELLKLLENYTQKDGPGVAGNGAAS